MLLASFEHEDDSLTQEMDWGSLIEDCGPCMVNQPLSEASIAELESDYYDLSLCPLSVNSCHKATVQNNLNDGGAENCRSMMLKIVASLEDTDAEVFLET